MTESRLAAEPRRYRLSWAYAPVLLLGSMLAGLGTLASVAINDEGFALEPDYYAKAVAWDEAQAQAADDARLGFQLDLTGPLLARADGSARLEVSLIDREGVRLSGATLAVEAFPNAHAQRSHRLELRELSPGVYAAELRHGERGLWELRFVVSHAGRRFTQILRRDMGGRAPA